MARQTMKEMMDAADAVITKPGSPAGSNGAFIVNQDDVLVVDTHWRPSFARELLEEIRKVTPLPVMA